MNDGVETPKPRSRASGDSSAVDTVENQLGKNLFKTFGGGLQKKRKPRKLRGRRSETKGWEVTQIWRC